MLRNDFVKLSEEYQKHVEKFPIPQKISLKTKEERKTPEVEENPLEEVYQKDNEDSEITGDESPQKQQSQEKKEEINKILTAVGATDDKEDDSGDSNLDDYLRKLEENT